MLSTALLVLSFAIAQPAKPAALPDTPQGRHVQAYLDAFNTGDEKKYLAMMDEHVDEALLKKRPAEERAKLFQRMRGDFGAFRISKVLKASPEQIQVAIPDKEGNVATFQFDFSAAAPYKISAMSVQIDKGGGH